MKITIDDVGKLTGVYLKNSPEDAIDVSEEILSQLESDQQYARLVDGQVITVNKPTDFEVAMALLRIERNQLLAKSDWMANSDVTMSTEWQSYRQALRDITTQTPSLDENGNLTGITWPTAPTD